MQRAFNTLSAWFGPMRGRLMIAFVLIVGMYFVLAFGEQAWRGRELEEEVAQRQAEVAELQAKRDSLQEQVSEYGSEQYITYVEQVARRDLNLAYPGETLMLIRWTPAPDDPAGDTVEPEKTGPEPNWRRWFEFLGAADVR
jgi:cell division protein FtsB